MGGGQGWRGCHVQVHQVNIHDDHSDVTDNDSDNAGDKSELMDTWIWFQSGINTDGAHNPLTNRRIQAGDILSLNCFPMIQGYYTALERTMFYKHVDDASLKEQHSKILTLHYGSLESYFKVMSLNTMEGL